jgi:hypothetical protein
LSKVSAQKALSLPLSLSIPVNSSLSKQTEMASPALCRQS